MVSKTHNPNINEPIRIRGIDFEVLLVVMLFLFAFLLIMGLSEIVFNLSATWLYFVGAIGFPSILYVFKKANSQGEQDFLDSWIAFWFFQPRKIRPYNPNYFSDTE